MIQRIQSLLLLGIVAISITLFFFSFSEKSYIDTESGKEVILNLQINKIVASQSGVIQNEQTHFMLLIVNLIILVASATIIFLYKNRVTQMKLCMLASLFVTIMLILIFYNSEAMGPEGTKAHYQVGVYLVAAQFVLLFAARKAIRKDEMLVRSADRIR